MTGESRDSEGKTAPSVTSGGPKWTQDQAIAFECARECITHLMACYSALIEDGSRFKMSPYQISAYEREITRLADERRELRVNDDEAVERIRREYGQMVKELLALMSPM